MRKTIWRSLMALVIIFILPGAINLAVWAANERPGSWRQADWSSAGILPPPKQSDASVYVLAARTGGMKGALASHSWLVLKKPGVPDYDRYDVVGWGKPVRKNAYDADGRWYSNSPMIHYEVHGEKAVHLINQIEPAIAQYRWSDYGDYTLWPGPNSNTFVATIIRAVPDFDAALPSTAVGRDFPADGRWFKRTATGAIRATLGGYAGFVYGDLEGLEVNFLGLVAGFNLGAREIKIPAVGSFKL